MTKGNNTQILANELVKRGLASIEQVESTLAKGKKLPFMTYAEWLKHGYRVKKGEKALFKVALWKALTRKNDKGVWENVLNEDGSQKFISPYCYIFSAKQVEKVGESQAETRPQETIKEEAVAVKKANDHVKEGQVYVVKYEKKAKKGAKAKTRKAETKKAKAVKTTKKSESVKTTPKKATKKATKQLATKKASNIEKIIENGVEFMQITMQKDGQFMASAKLPTSEYNAMKEADKKRFNRVWGIA